MGGLSHTVSGDIASFRTPSKVPIESLKFHFLPKQEGSGDPSLTNIRPITGWTGLNGKRAGKNLIEPNYGVETEQRGLTITPSANGISVSGTASARTAVFLSKANKNTKLGVGDKVTFSLYLNGDISECELPFIGYYKSPSVWGAVIGQLSSENNRKITWTVPNTYTDDSSIDSYIYVPQGVTVNFEIGLQMEKGTNATAYKPYFEGLIPITFPVSDGNLFSYDEDKFSLEDCVTSGSVIRRQVYHTGLTNGVFTLTAQIKEGYTRPSYNLFNIGICENGVNTIINTFIGTTEYIRGNYVNSNQELIIVSTTDDLNTADRTIKRYDIEIKNDAFYGGYVDVLLGEIVLTHAKTFVMWGEDGTDLGTVKRRSYTLPFTYKTGQELHNNGQGESKKMTLCDKAKWKWDYTADVEHYYIHQKNAYIYLNKSTPNDTKIELCAMLAEPFHIAITPQQLQAFLDHNNFWSDANDITEVTYAVTESKDILATRKKAMAFNHAHHKKVKWNQIAKDGNFDDSSLWMPSSTTYGSVVISDGIVTWTASQSPTQYYQTGVVHKSMYLNIPYDHKVFVTAKVRTTCSDVDARIYGMVGTYGATNSYMFRQAVNANEWTVMSGFIKDRPSEPPAGVDDTRIKRFKILLSLRPNASGSIETRVSAGDTLECQYLMAFDLTQMFGLGNEPQTVAEFEHICEINGIDLTTYQPYDEGSDRWLIVP